MHDANVSTCARVLSRPRSHIWNEYASAWIIVLDHHGSKTEEVHERLHKAVVCVAALAAQVTFRKTGRQIQQIQFQRRQCINVHIPQCRDVRLQLPEKVAALLRALIGDKVSDPLTSVGANVPLC